MHEYGLTQRIIQTAAQRADGAKVKTITLVVGEASGVLGESIQLYFDILAKGTPCEGAGVEIEGVKPMLRCRACGRLFVRKPFSFECPCGGEGEPTDIGREFYIKQIEVET